MSVSFSQLVLYFTLYSLLGWLCETIWCSIGERKPVNRGFLSGPWCPIYGFGALLILSVPTHSSQINQNPIIVFLISMLAATALEYITGWLLETLFQTKWWDYSQRRFNIKGRICLRNSLLFGLMGAIVTLLIHPMAVQLIGHIQLNHQRVLASLILALLIFDITRTLYSITSMKERLQEMKTLLQELEELQKEYAWFDKTDPTGSIARLRKICEHEAADEEAALILQKIDNLERRKGSGLHMLKAFPQMQPKGLLLEAETIRGGWREKHLRHKEESRLRRKNWFKKIQEAYKGITITRMVWVFFIGCIIGYVVETLYCLATKGVIESRQGMIYGPFNQVYGFGAVIMVLLLTPLVSRGNIWVFFGGAFVGGVFEAICSLVQETVFGSISWEYSSQPFSMFGGRTSLNYMLFWGILSVLYIKFIYPHMIKLIDNMPKRPKRFFTWVIAIFLSANLLLSAMAVSRWSNRVKSVPSKSGVEVWLDKHYTNEMLEEIYPNMHFVSTNDAGQAEDDEGSDA